VSAFDILAARGVTRLCHFTKLQSLTQIVSEDSGILPSSSIRSDIKNVTDEARYDGELDYICCSVEYPNSWFLEKAMINNIDKVFKDWLTVYINLDILNLRDAKFCPCNASTDRGGYITNDVNALFADPVCCKRKYSRSPKMFSYCTTDGQAEVLIKDGIPRKYIIGFAVGNVDMAKRVYAMLKTCGVRKLPIYVAPYVLTTSWSKMIQCGRRPSEELFAWSEEE
jgi:hypothetical protein